MNVSFSNNSESITARDFGLKANLKLAMMKSSESYWIVFSIFQNLQRSFSANYSWFEDNSRLSLHLVTTSPPFPNAMKLWHRPSVLILKSQIVARKSVIWHVCVSPFLSSTQKKYYSVENRVHKAESQLQVLFVRFLVFKHPNVVSVCAHLLWCAWLRTCISLWNDEKLSTINTIIVLSEVVEILITF